jgi:hypothetical protein
MSATNGKPRKRGRLIGLLMLVALALSAIFASSASANLFKPVQTTMSLGDSLAFGYQQQIFNEHLAEVEPVSNFEKGYANQFLEKQAFRLNKIRLENLGCPGETSGGLIGNGPLEQGLRAGEEFKAGHAIPPYGEAPCAYHNTAAEGAGFPKGTHFPLHVEYGENAEKKPASQLEKALEALVINDLGGTPVTTVTLNIGANDELHAIAKCEAEVTSEIVPEKGKFFSVYGGKENSEKGAALAVEAFEDGGEAKAEGKAAEEEGAAAAAEGAAAKAEGAEAEAEGAEAAEDGKEAEVAFGKGETELGGELAAEAGEDQKAAEAKGADAAAKGADATAKGKDAEAKGADAVAKGHEAEEDGAESAPFFLKAGEEAVKGCIEFHFEGLVESILTNIGRTMFVLRNAEVFTKFPGTDFKGNIVFQGGYDPFGRVYKTKAEVEAAQAVTVNEFNGKAIVPVHPFARARLGEQLPGTNGLAAVLNGHAHELVELTPEFHACWAGEQGGVPGKINTAFDPGLGHEEGPTGSLQKYTEMNNQTSAPNPFVPTAFLANGPDIHPSLAGAKDLALVMIEAVKAKGGTC